MPTVTVPLDKFGHTPSEKKKYTFDYSLWLDDGESVASATSEVSPSTTPAMVVSGITPTSTGVTFFVAGGKHGETYKVLITMTSSSGQIKEDCILVKVKDFTP